MINIGIIGCGAITQKRHAPEYDTNPNCRLSGVYDPQAERAETVSQRYGGKIFSRWQDLLADSSIDAVSICTPNRFHADMSIQALECGKHVLCEKPIAVNRAQAQAMIEASEKAGRFLMIGHNQRLDPVHRRARKLIEQGEIGKILTFETRFSHGGPELWSQDQGKHTWFFRSDDAFMGALGDLGVHKADLIRFLLGDEIEEVFAQVMTLDKRDDKNELIGVDDNALCLLKAKSGATGVLTASWTSYGQMDNSTILYGSQGIMKLHAHSKRPLECIRKSGEGFSIPLAELQKGTDPTRSGIIDAFIDSIQTGQTPKIDGRAGAAALDIVLACMESSQKKQAIRLSK